MLSDKVMTREVDGKGRDNGGNKVYLFQKQFLNE